MRLIDGDKLERQEYWGNERCFEYVDAEGIDNAPTVDAVPVVRCRDCKHYEIHKPKVLENCERNGYIIPMKPDDFCSYGERKDGDDE